MAGLIPLIASLLLDQDDAKSLEALDNPLVRRDGFTQRNLLNQFVVGPVHPVSSLSAAPEVLRLISRLVVVNAGQEPRLFAGEVAVLILL